MPYGSVTLVPGVNLERTPTLLKAGYSQSSLGRFKDSLFQKLGGWTRLYQFAVPGIPRDLHGWEDLSNTTRLSVASTTGASVITPSTGTLQDISPQTLISDFAPNFSTTMNTPSVVVTDSNISNVTVYDSIFFNTPVSIGGLVLQGVYPIVVIDSTHAYTITASANATSTVNNGGAVPAFTTSSGSNIVSVQLANHGLSSGNPFTFPIPTTVGGTTISGTYKAVTITDANNFTISTNTQATASTSGGMNGGDAELIYYLNIGPIAAGVGFGVGAFGVGGFGSGVVPGSQTGDDLGAPDWTQDNWGEILLACPKNGGVFQWAPSSGFNNMGLVATAPIFNGGIFVAMPAQILVCWGSTSAAPGSTSPSSSPQQQDPLIVRWSDQLDFTNFVVDSADQAGSFRIPTGSMIVGGMQAPNQSLVWTDIDLWAMNYIQPPLVYGFNKIGAGAGLAGAHAAGQMRGNVYWMGQTNFYALDGNGVSVIPCPVWDVVFQNLDTTNLAKIRAAPNTPFNEMWWFYPSKSGGTGENDSYVKFNVSEPGAPWDYGPLPRSAWIDQSVLGMPIGASPQSLIYQHETTNDADGAPLLSSFTSGYFYLSEGEDYAFVDQIIPDLKFGTYAGAQTAQVTLTFNVINYPGDAPRIYGPFLMTSTTQYLTPRFRGRQMSVTIQSSDVGSFWRIGMIRWRYAPDGRR